MSVSLHITSCFSYRKDLVTQKRESVFPIKDNYAFCKADGAAKVRFVLTGCRCRYGVPLLSD